LPDLKKIPENPSGRRRYFRQMSASESVDKSRSTLFINFAVEGLSTLVLLIGIGYALWFLTFYGHRFLDDAYFKLFLVSLVLFGFFLIIYSAKKMLKIYFFLKKANTEPPETGKPPETP
jgi:hypothetical protein